LVGPRLLGQPRHGAALRGRAWRDPLPAGPDQVIEMLGRSRAGVAAAAAGTLLRVAGSTFDALRAAWRSEAKSGTRAYVPGWAVICARAARRKPS